MNLSEKVQGHRERAEAMAAAAAEGAEIPDAETGMTLLCEVLDGLATMIRWLDTTPIVG